MGCAGRLAVLCEHVLGNISLAIPDNQEISFAIERIIDFSRSIGIHYIILPHCPNLIKHGKYHPNKNSRLDSIIYVHSCSVMSPNCLRPQSSAPAELYFRTGEDEPNESIWSRTIKFAL